MAYELLEIRPADGSLRINLRRHIVIVFAFAATLTFLILYRQIVMSNGSPTDHRPIRGHKMLSKIGEKCNDNGDTINRKHSIVIDAGSTGSRVHAYQFQYCGDQLQVLVDELFQQVKPGLSSIKASKAMDSLLPLIRSASDFVPGNEHSITPMTIQATAGLRLLPKDQSGMIISTLRRHQQNESIPFQCPADKIGIMDGKEEATFAWLGVNFLKQSLTIEESVAVLDLGGGSSQIVFAHRKHDQDAAAENLNVIEFSNQKFTLYQQSKLGYGMVEARKRVKQEWIAKMIGDKPGVALKFPCHPIGHEESIDIEGKKFTLVGQSDGWDHCLQSITPLFSESMDSTVKVSADIIAFSYYYDTLIPLGLSSHLQIWEIEERGRNLCTGKSRLYGQNPDWCLDIVYIWSLLVHGYGLDVDQSLEISKQVEGYEAGWSLGAALMMMDQREEL